jgi:hypothetical protein
MDFVPTTTIGEIGDVVFEESPKNEIVESGDCVTFSCKVKGTKPIGNFNLNIYIIVFSSENITQVNK